MADIHVLTDDGSGKVAVVLHIPTPSGTNVPGVTWADALINSGIGGTTRLPESMLGEGEKAAIENGTLFEHSTTVAIESGSTEPAAQRVQLRALSVRKREAAIFDLQRRLKYFGHTESEA